MTTPTIKLVATELLDDDTRNAIIHVCVTAHNEPDFRNLFRYIPGGGLHFLAYDQEVLVSHAVVTTRWAQPEGLPLLKTAYVDAVATLPDYQGLGYASALLRQIQTRLDDYELACLETDIVEFYERLGWLKWQGMLAGRNESGLIATPGQRGIMVLPIGRTPGLDPAGRLVIEIEGDRIW